jgi:GNAT superfamily N-acetyltransferase
MDIDFTIRSAEPRDAQAFVQLVRALADFERLQGPDDAAAARLVEHAFGDRPRFELLVAESQGQVVGYALFFMNYSSFRARPGVYLEDLFVLPAWRGRGVGEGFIRRLAQLAVARGCARFEWTVLEWNVRAQAFYRRLGAQLLDEWRVCRVDGPALAALGAVEVAVSGGTPG